MNYLEKIKKLIEFVQINHVDLTYHNFNHAIEVFDTVTKRTNSLNEKERFCVQASALIHDIIYVPFRKDNEEKSIALALPLLIELGCDEAEIELISGCVLSTKIPQIPRNDLQKILCDADLDNLGREDFFEKNVLVRLELGLDESKEWWTFSLNLLNQTYFTKLAQSIRGQKRKQNYERVKTILSKHSLTA
jgi:uncharacterized protein